LMVGHIMPARLGLFSAILLLSSPHLRNNHFIYRYLLITRRFLLDFIEPLNIGLSP